MAEKKRRPGRPKLPKGKVMGRIVQVRLTPDEFKAVTLAAKSSNQTLSAWIRGTLRAASHA